MTITKNIRQVLDRKTWEMMTPSPFTNIAGAFTMNDHTGVDDTLIYVGGVSAIYQYIHTQDAWLQLPNSGIAGTFGVGACGSFHIMGPSGTATAGSTTTITTNLTIPRSIAGYKVRITAGTNVGAVDNVILSNTIGANSIITVTTPYGSAVDATTVYALLTGRFWFFNPGAGAVGFAYWDRALSAWTQKAVTNLPTTFATDGRLVIPYGARATFANGTATSATATTLVQTGKTWTASQWINYQIRIVSGTGAGQVRTITANDATSVTVAAWTVQPAAASVYVIEGNDDFMYLLGNNAVTMYRYSISGNTWSTLSPGAARAGAPVAGMGAGWISESPNTVFTNESAIINGRRIYSFRGGASTLDYYDIPGNTWVSGVTYGDAMESFAAGSCYEANGDFIYISSAATGRLFRFSVGENRLIPWSTLLYTLGAALVGDKLWTHELIDGATTLLWVYYLNPSSTHLFRCMDI